MRLATSIALTAMFVLPGNLSAQTGSEGRAMWLPSAMRWEAILYGDPTASGRYTLRVRLPAGYKIAPHVYDGTREVTVISGTLNFSYGDKYRPEGYTSLGPGSFFVEAAKVPLFFETREPVELQISGNGPVRRPQFVNPKDEPK